MFSIIITTCNRDPSVVLRAINSVLLQTYRDVEVIVVNDSPDYEKREELEESIRKVGKGIKIVTNPQPKGANYSRNVGFALSKGEYISFLDDDDFWNPTRLEMVIQEFENGADIVYSDYYIVNGSRKRYSHRGKPDTDKLLETILYDNFLGGFSNVSFTREIFSDCGMLDESFLSYQDQDLFIRFIENGKLSYIPQALSNYCLTATSISSNPIRKITGLEKLLKKYEDLFTRFPSSWKKKIESEYVLSVKNGWKENSIYLGEKYLERHFSKTRLVFLKAKGNIKRLMTRISMFNYGH